MAAQDLLLTSLEGDLKIGNNGDLVIGLSDDQHIHDIIHDEPGEWHQFPTVGVGLENYQFGPVNTNILQQNIRMQLIKDGYVCSPQVSYSYQTGLLTVNPRAYRN